MYTKSIGSRRIATDLYYLPISTVSSPDLLLIAIRDDDEVTYLTF